MKSKECNGGFQPADWATRDGKLLFPTVKGVVVADPTHADVPAAPFRVPIEETIVDGHALGDFICGYESFFSAAATSLSSPRKLRFAIGCRDSIASGSMRACGG